MNYAKPPVSSVQRIRLLEELRRHAAKLAEEQSQRKKRLAELREE